MLSCESKSTCLVYTSAGESCAGIVHWQMPQSHADGISISLYEHKASSTQHYGDPIADVFAIVARPNSSIIAVADGCGWGIKPRLAARCAVHGCVDHLNAKLFDPSNEAQITTQDIFRAMFRSLHAAQKCIIDRGGTTTTLCLAVVVELMEARGINKWGLCVVSVGDSLCYVWRNDSHEVFEVTMPMEEGKERNVRDAGGCLGADLGDHPDLTNLHCCFAPVADEDVIFLCSDGVSDNFDPVTLREAVSDSNLESPQNLLDSKQLSSQDSGSVVPSMNPSQRHNVAMMSIARLLNEKWMEKQTLSASNVKEVVTTHVIETTEEKRTFLEQVGILNDSTVLTQAEKRDQERRIGHAIKRMPGKLDHATIAAFKVGNIVRQNPTHSYCMNTAVADGRREDNGSVHGQSTFYSKLSDPKPSFAI